MQKIYPQKLKRGDEVRILSLARSASIVPKKFIENSKKHLEELGLKVSFGKNAFQNTYFDSASVDDKISDLNEAFLDPNVKAIIVSIGGFNSNQLLDIIDWNIIRKNPKIFAGFSDITAITNAILAMTGVVTYGAPNFYSLGITPDPSYSLDYIKKCLFSDKSFEVLASKEYYDFPWKYCFEDRPSIYNEGFGMINPGKASGTIIGGNMCTLNLLNGTRYFPKIDGDIILLIEDDCYDSIPVTFERNLESITQQSYFNQVRAIIIGRFQGDSNVSKDALCQIVSNNKKLSNIPVAYNFDFGHTDPKITYPIGGKAEISFTTNEIVFKILSH